MTTALDRRLQALEADCATNVRTCAAALVCEGDATLRQMSGPHDYRDQLPGESAEDYVKWLKADGWHVILVEYVEAPACED
jgi:hypothetical protein